MTEGDVGYRPGACTELGCTSPPGTYGVERRDDGVRIVWHYRASSEERVFRVGYRLRGVATAYDDVVDVNLQVWGDEWETGLTQLTAQLLAPGDVERAWGHPVSVRGDVTIEGSRVSLRALDVPARQFVELRALVPRRFFTSTAGMKVESGPGLDKIVAEELDDAAAYERDRRKIDEALDNLPRTIAILLALALGPALALIGFVWWREGRERRTTYDREYEQEPPTETQPALVPALLAQGGAPGSLEFTATLFDLIRRGRYVGEPVTTEQKMWGGLKTQHVADLELSLADVEAPVEAFEAPVAEVVDAIVAEGPERLSRFRDRIEDDRTSNSDRFTRFKSAVGHEVSGRKWFQNQGLAFLVVGAIVLGVIGGITLFAGISGFDSVAPSWRSVVTIALGVCGLVGAVALVIASLNRRLWRRRSPAAQAEAERWEAFRRYLTDFPRLDEAPPATLQLWERFLVYGITFGIAERVLQGAQLHMPEALAQASSLYWIGPHGDLSSGATSMSIGDLAAGFGSALAPPRPARAASAAASPAAAAAAAAGAAAAPGRRPDDLVADSDLAGALVERDRPCNRHVERFRRAGRGDRRSQVAVSNELGRQPRTLRAEQERDRAGEVDLRERRRSVRDERDPAARRLLERKQRNAEDRPDRGAERLRPERVGATGGEPDRGAERVGGAQQRADVAGVGDAPERERDLARLTRQVGGAVDADDPCGMRQRRERGQQARLDGFVRDEQLDGLDRGRGCGRDEILALDREQPELLALALLREELPDELQRRVRRRGDQGRGWRSVARRRGAMLVPRQGRRSPRAGSPWATEDAASGRAAQPGDSADAPPRAPARPPCRRRARPSPARRRP